MIFDTHAHYYDDAFDADRDALLSTLPEKGVALVVCPGCDLESSRQSMALAERYDYLMTLPPASTRRTWKGPPLPSWTR